VESGAAGIYTNGTAAEFYSQSEEEFDRISRMVAERCEAAGMAFQIGASQMSPQLSLARIRRAAELRPGAIQVILSDWYPLSDDEMITCMEGFAAAADPVGLVLYNPRTPNADCRRRISHFWRKKCRRWQALRFSTATMIGTYGCGR